MDGDAIRTLVGQEGIGDGVGPAERERARLDAGASGLLRICGSGVHPRIPALFAPFDEEETAGGGGSGSAAPRAHLRRPDGGIETERFLEQGRRLRARAQAVWLKRILLPW